MYDDVLQPLLKGLCEGDPVAAEAAFRAYEPYLRTIVRRQLSARLRRKFDSVDVVQSVWADVFDGLRKMRWQFDDLTRLRAFLIRMTRNRLIDHLRHHRTALERETPFADEACHGLPPDPEPRPSQVAQAEELWQRMLRLCAPSHRPILELKRQGLALADIAARTGLHPSSIRRILYELARKLAESEEAGSRLAEQEARSN